MGYIPEDAEWYLAELVMEITVHGGRCNVIHRNLTLINAHSPDEAYSRAIRVGQEGETRYKNPKDQLVEIRFRGISRLNVVYEPLEDGSELLFEEELSLTEFEIQRMIPAKRDLAVFTPPRPGEEHDPDYRSKAVMQEAVNLVKKVRPDE